MARELSHQSLVQQFALRAEQDHRPFSRPRSHRLEDRFRFQYHARTAPIWDVVHLAVPIVRVVAEVMQAEGDEPGVDPPTGHP